MYEALWRFLHSPVSVLYGAGYGVWMLLLGMESAYSRLSGRKLYDWRDTATNAVMYAGYFFINLFWSMFAGPKAGDNPWGDGATTLEWTLSSPPPYHQFETLPVID